MRTSYSDDGIRQLAASIQARGLLQPVIRPSPDFLAEVQLIENIQREDLSPADLEVALRSLVDRYGSQEKVAQLLVKSKQWVSNIPAASRVREAVTPTLERLNLRDSVPSGHLKDLAALPPAAQSAAADEALRSGGSKRAFREAARRVKGATASSPGRPGTAMRLTFTVAVERRGEDVVLRPGITGDPSPEVRDRFDAFCAEIRTLLSSLR